VCRRSGISFVEVLVSMVVMSVLMVVALNTIGGAAQSYAQLNAQAKGEMLAQELLGEIMAQPYAENGGTTIGTEAGELTGTRAMFDDVDDYHHWSASPPALANGTTLPDLEGWTRSAEVQYVCPDNVNKRICRVPDAVDEYECCDDGRREVSVDLGVKLITVTVTYQGRVVATAVGVRTSGSDASLTAQDNAIK